MKHPLEGLRIKIFADGADLEGMVKMANMPWVAGLTTNPTLMRRAGVSNYEKFGREVLEKISTLPVSLEVFSDDFDEMHRQALVIDSWGDNVYVKVPITNTRGESSAPLISRLSNEGVKLNVTALMYSQQVRTVVDQLVSGIPTIVSVFAGRVADSGRDPVPVMRDCLKELEGWSSIELLWASPREVFNLIQAEEVGCHIITVTNELLEKAAGFGRPLDEISLDTVKMFYRDAVAAGFEL